MPGLAYFTICSQNYLGYALTLGRSLKYADPDATFFIGLADEWDSSLPRDQIEFPVIEARDIGLPTFNDMIVRYSIMEFNTAIKARMFGHLFVSQKNAPKTVPQIAPTSQQFDMWSGFGFDVACYWYTCM